jgi:hypothetical protein
VNQDPLGLPARRLVGEDLVFPCGTPAGAFASVEAVPCDANDVYQQWDWDATKVRGNVLCRAVVLIVR